MRKVISNTTPLIALADIGCFDILQKIYEEIMIPAAVLEEVKSEPAKTLVTNNDFIRVFPVADSQVKKMFSSRLHAGEIEVMLLAEEKQADLLIMDDNSAKKMAKFLGFNVTGTLGVLLKAKNKGYINEIQPFVDKLQDNGFYVSFQVKQYVLEEAKELI